MTKTISRHSKVIYANLDCNIFEDGCWIFSSSRTMEWKCAWLSESSIDSVIEFCGSIWKDNDSNIRKKSEAYSFNFFEVISAKKGLLIDNG